jgi:hypothetical protein
MLYGTRPFGEGKSQEIVWSENLIYKSNQVEFPNDPKTPKVSDEAKDLIRACLTKDVKLRFFFRFIFFANFREVIFSKLFDTFLLLK